MKYKTPLDCCTMQYTINSYQYENAGVKLSCFVEVGVKTNGFLATLRWHNGAFLFLEHHLLSHKTRSIDRFYAEALSTTLENRNRHI